VRVWRLTRAPFAGTPFDGVGPARGGGRWNSRGTYVAYAASSRALAILEVLVHINREQAPTDYVFIEAEIPDDAIEILDVTTLPKGWQGEPPLASLRATGDGWVRSNGALALRVPSVVVPEEANFLINPGHPRSGELQIVGAPQPAILDPRLLG
jgi:RES domain-containing protein